MDERVELTVSGRFDAMETLLAVVIFDINAIKKQQQVGWEIHILIIGLHWIESLLDLSKGFMFE
ncbi:MAG: hypothetical protein D6160_08010 [Ketobacter sp.]|nr:MAG: hypothetical protein D6160_08010 [Ketobacter sp.]